MKFSGQSLYFFVSSALFLLAIPTGCTEIGQQNVADDLAAQGALRSTSRTKNDNSIHNLDLFHPSGQEKAAQLIDETLDEHDQRNLLFRNQVNFGSACDEDTDCGEGFSCQSTSLPFRLRRRCMLTPDSCVVQAASMFASTFDNIAWRDQVLERAGFFQPDEVAEAAMEANREEDFLQSQAIQNIVAAIEASLPFDQTNELQAAVDSCNSAATEQDTGTLLYYGTHLELSTALDLAWSLFKVNTTAGEVSFNRFTIGAELGVGVELSFLVGFAFNATISDFEGGAIVYDKDVLPVLTQGGGALVYNLNGMKALELTFGLGTGKGKGIGFAQTSKLEEQISGFRPRNIVNGLTPNTVDPSNNNEN